MRRNAPARHPQKSPGGPLITNHLKDLDLELELLRRKREMIERQQHMLNVEPFQHQFNREREFDDYERPHTYSYESYSYDRPQFNSNRDYSHMYDDPPALGSQYGRKRHADPDWLNPPSSKMFAPKRKNVQASFGSRLGPKPGGPNNGPAPLRYPKPQPSSSANKPPNKSLAPLMSIRTGRPLLKTPLKNLPKVNKPKPVAAAPTKLASQKPVVRAPLVAQATKSSPAVDEAPILREDCEPTPQMIGRMELALGTVLKDVKAKYEPSHRALFSSFRLLRVMKQEIRDRVRAVMLGKPVSSFIDIKNIYREQYPEESDIEIVTAVLKADEDFKKSKEANPEPVYESKAPKDDGGAEIYYKSHLNAVIDARLSEIFNKMKELNKEKIDELARTPDKDNLSEPSTTDILIEDTPKQDTPKEDTSKEDNIPKEDTSKEDNTPKEDTPNDDDAKYMEVFQKTVKRYLPKLLRQYTPTMYWLLNVDEMYKSTKPAMLEFIKQKKSSVSDSQQATCGTTPSNKPGATKPASINTLPYFVKVKSRPGLPKKRVMSEFLEKFNTKTIKKHKGVHNLLFIGFSDKSDYENILLANGTQIGRFTLEITPSERATQKPGTSNTEVISPELDGKITDLLTSIRKADEEGKKEIEVKKEIDEAMDISTDGTAHEIESEDRKEENEKTITEVDGRTITNDADNEINIKTEIEDLVCDEKNGETTDKSNKVDDNNKTTEVDKGDLEKDTAEKIAATPDKTGDSTEKVAESNGKSPTNDADKVTSENTDKPTENVAETSENVTKSAEPLNNDTKTPEEVVDAKKPEDSDKLEKAALEKNDKVAELKSEIKESGRSTPTRTTRSSTVTPSTIRTRRASRLNLNQ